MIMTISALTKALVGVGLLPSALALGWPVAMGSLTEPKAADKDAAMREHFSAS